MFSQPPEEGQNNTPRRRTFKYKNKRKGRRKSSNKKQFSQRHFTNITMSNWAENFTRAATWQMKQQIAYWKSKALALKYENDFLHDIIRKNYVNSEPMALARNVYEGDEDVEHVQDSHSPDEVDNDDLECSEEFIQFLMNNAKFKEDARRERERFKALEEDDEAKLIKELEAMPTKSAENTEEIMKELYGNRWQKIAALEASLQSQFIEKCDLDKPMLWPNIPLNFNFNK